MSASEQPRMQEGESESQQEGQPPRALAKRVRARTLRDLLQRRDRALPHMAGTHTLGPRGGGERDHGRLGERQIFIRLLVPYVDLSVRVFGRFRSSSGAEIYSLNAHGALYTRRIVSRKGAEKHKRGREAW